MRRGRIAELLLSLVTGPERAAATAGDLIEGASGPLAFWKSATVTFLAMLWQRIADAPKEMGWFAASLLGQSLVWHTLVTGAVLFVAAFAVALKALDAPSWFLWLPAVIEGVGRSVLVPWVLGRWAVRKDQAAALAAVLCFECGLLLSSVVASILDISFPTPAGSRVLLWQVLLPIPGGLVTIVAVVVQGMRARAVSEVA
jgi:hypothetical protein